MNLVCDQVNEIELGISTVAPAIIRERYACSSVVDPKLEPPVEEVCKGRKACAAKIVRGKEDIGGPSFSRRLVFIFRNEIAIFPFYVCQ